MNCCLIKEEHYHCSCCDRVMYGEKPVTEFYFCSVDCACMSGKFSVREGWINNDQPIRKLSPKLPWWLPEDFHANYMAEITGRKLKDAGI